ncbi:putative pectin methylesterase [Lentinula raphanica]|nr:putative pectin methylesterase [Lentinula raphanica]
MAARRPSFILILAVLFACGALLTSHSVEAKPVQPKTALRKRTARNTAPAGALVVSKSPSSGQFSTVQAAVNALPDDGSEQTIFIESGTYDEQVYIDRSGMLTIMGETADTSNYESNVVTISNSLSATAAGSDDLSGTLRVHKDDFALYNVNVKNTFGQGSQALALSAYGTNHGYYGSGFYSYQDTVLAEQGAQFYGYCYIEGAVDFIFGQHGFAFFQRTTIASIGPGAITADGPASKTDGLFVINESTIEQSSAATEDLTGLVFLGRPWTEFATVAYTSCTLGSVINSAGWEEWSSTEPNTEDVTFAEYDNGGPGSEGTRASFATKITSNADYTAAAVLGSDWTSWVDQGYVDQ